MTSVQDLRQQYREHRQRSQQRQLPLPQEHSWSSLDHDGADMDTGDIGDDTEDGSVSSSLSVTVASRRFVRDDAAARQASAPLDVQDSRTLQKGQSWGNDVTARNKMLRAPK